VFTGPVREELAATPDLDARERWVVGPLIALMLVFGFVPGPALDLVRPPADVTLQQVGVEPYTAPHGAQEGTDK
jgi:NADH-quinone oxidoreductase subunit M